jgi:2'-5' RNA ligase
VENKVRSGLLGREPRFPYHPHVTIAHDLGEDVLDRAYKELSRYEASFTVWGFSLYEHGPDGVWRPQRDFAFGAGGHGPRRG